MIFLVRKKIAGCQISFLVDLLAFWCEKVVFGALIQNNRGSELIIHRQIGFEGCRFFWALEIV